MTPRTPKTQTPNQKTRGMRLTESLLPVFGPAQVGDLTAPTRPATPQDKARDEELNSQLERRISADGTPYLVAKPHN